MKKVIRSVLLLTLALTIVLSVAPAASAIDLQANKSTVYRFLTNTLKLNRAAACGIMANIEQESNFDPSLVVVDSNGLLSGGLFMWNGSRFTALKKFCKDKGYNHLSIKGQMNFLKSEMKSTSKKVYSYMKSVSNDKDGAYNAGYYWCYNFERPANKAKRSAFRGNLAKKYFSSFKPTGSVEKVTVSTNAEDGKISLFSTLKISWTSGGEDATGYVVEIAKYINGKYRWDIATGAYTTGKSSYFSCYELGAGKYAARVTSKSDYEEKISSVIKFKIVCEDHLYSAKVTIKATATENGERVFTCQHCGKKITKTIKAGKLKTDAVMDAPKVTAVRGKNATKLKYSSVKGADGYIVYIMSNGEWIKIAEMPATTSYCKLPDVFAGDKLAVCAYDSVGSKTLKSAASPVKVS